MQDNTLIDEVTNDEKDFFESNSYFIDEKVNFFKFENAYRIFNEKGDHIGAITQRLSAGQKILRLLVNKKILPFHLDIHNHEGEVQTTIQRGWTLLLSKITVLNSKGELIGTIKQKFKIFNPEFEIFNASNELIGSIKGNWHAWNFEIKDASKKVVGTINKKWAGLAKEIFTTADKYNVTIDPAFSSSVQHKQAVISCAITIDMVLKESK
jgi:uncharacterized protein YxjI